MLSLREYATVHVGEGVYVWDVSGPIPDDILRAYESYKNRAQSLLEMIAKSSWNARGILFVHVGTRVDRCGMYIRNANTDLYEFSGESYRMVPNKAWPMTITFQRVNPKENNFARFYFGFRRSGLDLTLYSGPERVPTLYQHRADGTGIEVFEGGERHFVADRVSHTIENGKLLIHLYHPDISGSVAGYTMMHTSLDAKAYVFFNRKMYTFKHIDGLWKCTKIVQSK